MPKKMFKKKKKEILSPYTLVQISFFFERKL